MQKLVIFTAAEQVAAHLRAEILRGVLSGLMPGGEKLAAELGIGPNTAEAALVILEKEGLLVSQGARRGRSVVARPEAGAAHSLRIAILLNDSGDLALNYMVEIRHALESAGHSSFIAPKTMEDLGHDVERIKRMAMKTEAEAWLVLGGSYELLNWFLTQTAPTFAIFGRRRELKIAGTGPDKSSALIEATRRLIELGHRRIVLMTRTRRRMPKPGEPERLFLKELAAHGMPVGDYALPPWEETTKGFHARLEALFRFTPPTAMIIDEAPLFFATQQFLARKRLTAPEDVSLVCTDYSPDFNWCQPTISHIRWESPPMIRNLMKWITNVSLGKEDFRQTETPAKFVLGGTIGRVPRGR